MRRRLRWILFLGASAWMLLSPAYVQVFGGSPTVVRAWRMFHLRGIGICSAVYTEHGERLDRYRLLGTSRGSAPARLRRITDAQEARAIGRQLCAARGPGADVRVELRCGDRYGLRPVIGPDEELCDR
jgi:hypothetical protein